MTRRLPVLPTLIVAAAAAIMIGLGIWQLDRAAWKDAVLARAERNLRQPLVDLPSDVPAGLDYRRVSVACLDMRPLSPQAGKSTRGTAGWRQTALCTLPGNKAVAVAVGVSAEAQPAYRLPSPARFTGRLVPRTGKGGDAAYLLVAETAPQGLEAAAAPSPDSIPRNHRFYAAQWFLFAALAVLIYGIALRARLRRRATVFAPSR